MLATLLGSKLRAKVLGWLFTHPDERYFVRQLTSLLQEDSTNVSRELSRLANLGVLIPTREGKHKYYQANRESPFFDELHGLMVKTVGLADVLRSALAPIAARIKVAFVFGSMASGGEQRTSDVDMMVIGDVTFNEVVSSLSPAEETIHREVNPVVYPVAEFRQKTQRNHHFLRTVLEGEKIFLIGDDGELAGLVGKRLAD
jgi:predicted nucleotidyltransferase